MKQSLQHAWQELEQHHQLLSQTPLKTLFNNDSQRFQHFSVQHDDILYDFSKNHLLPKTISLLTALAQAAELPEKIQDLFMGYPLNQSEARPALHTALRDQQQKAILLDGYNIIPDIQNTLQRMASMSQAINENQWCGATHKPITDILHIGIGGSELGPKLLNHALSSYKTSSLKLHFLTSIDGAELCACLESLNPETTLVIVASKSFTTNEPLTNASVIKQWLSAHLNEASCDQIMQQHFIAVTQNVDNALAFGIKPTNILPIWHWVGGRYSIWSAMALPVVLMIGMDHFHEFLQGAYSMDQHFKTTPLAKNIPALLALVGIWYRNFFHTSSHVILPYDHHLKLLPDYLQQLEMESNGKCWQQNDKEVFGHTASVLWGKTGLMGQHSFYQLLHQGTQIIPADFIVCAQSSHDYDHHHHLVLANCFAQSQALMLGNQQAASNNMCQQHVIRGNRPSNTFVLAQLTPYNLGALLAMYEHKVFTQSVIWNINPFDQWSVELGKRLAKDILPVLEEEKTAQFDSSTNGLLEHCEQFS